MSMCPRSVSYLSPYLAIYSNAYLELEQAGESISLSSKEPLSKRQNKLLKSIGTNLSNYWPTSLFVCSCVSLSILIGAAIFLAPGDIGCFHAGAYLSIDLSFFLTYLPTFTIYIYLTYEGNYHAASNDREKMSVSCYVAFITLASVRRLYGVRYCLSTYLSIYLSMCLSIYVTIYLPTFSAKRPMCGVALHCAVFFSYYMEKNT